MVRHRGCECARLPVRIPVMTDHRPGISESLVAEMQEAVLRELRAHRGPIQYRQVVANIAATRGLPRSREESHQQPSAAVGIEFVEVNVAVAEAIWRLIGLGFAVPFSGSDNPETSWTVRTSNSTGSDREEALDVQVPQQIRISSAGADWLESGSVIIRNPDLFLYSLPTMGDRVRACLREAVEAFRRQLTPRVRDSPRSGLGGCVARGWIADRRGNPQR